MKPDADLSTTRSPKEAIPLTGTTLNVPESLAPTLFTAKLIVMGLTKAVSGRRRLSSTSICTAGVMMLPAVASLGWTIKKRASGPLPPPPPLIESPPLLVSRRSYGHAAVTSAVRATVTRQSLLLISKPSPRASHDYKTLRTPQEP